MLTVELELERMYRKLHKIFLQKKTWKQSFEIMQNQLENRNNSHIRCMIYIYITDNYHRLNNFLQFIVYLYI